MQLQACQRGPVCCGLSLSLVRRREQQSGTASSERRVHAQPEYVGVVAHVRGRTAALVCRIPSLLPNGAGCSVVATSVFACPDYWGCGATFTLSCVVGGLAGRSQEDCVISHMTNIYRPRGLRFRLRVGTVKTIRSIVRSVARRGRSLRCTVVVAVPRRGTPRRSGTSPRTAR